MIRLEEMTKMHVDSVAELEKKTFPVPWSKKAFEDELKNKLAKYIVAIDEESERVIGFGGMWQIINEANITNIAVDEQYRNKGIATAIMNKLEEIAIAEEMIGLTLEVRVSNMKARSLYTKLGYKLEGIRKEYYEDNREDALIMWKYLIDEELIISK